MPVPHTKVASLEERLEKVEKDHADTRAQLSALASAVSLLVVENCGVEGQEAGRAQLKRVMVSLGLAK